MSSPDTNPRKQARRHWAPLVGILIVVVFGVGLILFWVGEEVAQAPEQDTAPNSENPSAGDVQDGGVNVPAGAPEGTADPEPVNPGSPEL